MFLNLFLANRLGSLCRSERYATVTAGREDRLSLVFVKVLIYLISFHLFCHLSPQIIQQNKKQEQRKLLRNNHITDSTQYDPDVKKSLGRIIKHKFNALKKIAERMHEYL